MFSSSVFYCERTEDEVWDLSDRPRSRIWEFHQAQTQLAQQASFAGGFYNYSKKAECIKI